MTIICSNCGSENHINKDICIDCGEKIYNGHEYIICSICALSNPITSETCEGCGEILNSNKMFKLDDSFIEEENSKVSLDSDSPVVTKKSKKKKQKNRIRKLIVLMSIILIFVFSALIFIFMESKKIFIESSDGFYYITESNELHIVNDSNDDFTILKNVSGPFKIHVFGNNGYVYTNNELYKFQKTEVVKIADNINSYTISLSGKEILYTSSITSTEEGDLYLFDGEISNRIDANVENDRYCFGINSSEVYYVTDITSEESLGILYLKEGGNPSVEVAQDVFKPIISLKRGSVYFVRNNLTVEQNYNLYYATEKRVTEIARNVKNIIVTPNFEEMIIVQSKENTLKILKNRREKVTTLAENIKRIGLRDFESEIKPIQLVDSKSSYLFFTKDDEIIESCQLNSKEITTLSEPMEKYYLSSNNKIIYYIYEDELSKSQFKDGIVSKSISLASHTKSVSQSLTGKTSVFTNNNDSYFLINDKYTREIGSELEYLHISKNEKYLIYKNLDEKLYALKVGARKDILIDEEVDDIFVINNYVYSVSMGKLSYYKMGKYSSNKSVSPIIEIGLFN